MRKIKFRVWIIAENRMLPVASIDSEFRVVQTGSGVYDFNQVKMMEYTGLKDKNGKEICEGDVVKWGVHVGVVEFHYTGNWVFKGNMVLSPRNLKAEIIGNIYENPELLKGIKHDEK